MEEAEQQTASNPDLCLQGAWMYTFLPFNFEVFLPDVLVNSKLIGKFSNQMTDLSSCNSDWTGFILQFKRL